MFVLLYGLTNVVDTWMITRPYIEAWEAYRSNADTDQSDRFGGILDDRTDFGERLGDIDDKWAGIEDQQERGD